jgi:hypothetical protein
MASQPGGFVDKSFEPRTLDEHDLSRGRASQQAISTDRIALIEIFYK